MESAVHNFANYLEDSVRSDSPKEAGKLIKHVRKYLDDNVGHNALNFAIAKIFDDPYNLLKFLGHIKDKANQKGWKEVLSYSLELLEHFLRNFYNKLQPNALEIIKVCRLISISNAQATEKSKAINVLCHILKHDSDIPVDEITNMYESYFRFCGVHQKTTSAKVQKNVFILLGIISNKYPYLIANHANLIDIYVLQLKKQSDCSEKDRDNTVVSGCIDGLSNVLETFPITTEESKAKIYRIISKLLLSGSTKFSIRDVVKFISRHCSMLIENIYENGPEQWFNAIKMWALSTGENKKAGYIALEKFYEQLAILLKNKNDQKALDCYQYFFDYFLRTMKDERADIIEVRLAIRGFGYFSIPCDSDKQKQQQNLSQMFMIIVNRIEHDYFVQENPSMEQLEYLPDYTYCFSRILYQIGEYTFDQIDSLQQISVLMIKTFPKLSAIYYFSVFDSMILSMCYLYEKNPKSLENYLQRVVYQGVLWTCSHRTCFDLNPEDNKSITYKNYLPLWRNLLNFLETNNDKYNAIQFDVKKSVVQILYDELIKTLLLLINKLNLNTLPKDDIFDPQINCEAEKIDDFIIFINVVDFYVDLSSSINNNHFKKWSRMYINQIVMQSTKFPYISGYYKLLQLGLQISDNLHCFDEDKIRQKEDKQILYKKLLSYLERTIHNVHEFKDDLQVSCLQLLLTIPLSFVSPLLPTFIPIFKMSLDVGRGYLKLAETSVDTLEKWFKFLPISELKPLLKEVLPSLDQFLRSTGFVGDPDIKLPLLEKKSKRTKKRRVVIEGDSELANLQNKILMFAGQLDSELCLYLIKTDVAIDQVTWEKQPYLKFNLPYNEMKPSIYLDRIIPRILELALSSGDQKTRITACELLHSVVIFMLGTSRQMSLSELDQLSKLFKKVMLPVIQLGCDSNDVVRQLFNPLVFQMIHWYSSPLQLMSSETSVLIDILMEGISHPNNTSVRDLSGKCIKEFVVWTMKQCRKEDLAKNSQNIHIIISKICSFCTHPNSFKRSGAALAFNHLYTHLREELSMVDRYWIELTYSLMINMSLEEKGQSTVHLDAAMNHIERVLREKNSIFNKHSIDRKVPQDLTGPLLKDLVLWVMKQTASNNTIYRRKSIKLFCNLSPYVENCGCAKNFVTKFVTDEIYENQFQNLPRLDVWDKLGNVEIIFKYFQYLLTDLDNYKYLFDYDILNHRIDDLLFDSLKYFLINISTSKLEQCLKLFPQYDTDYICLPGEIDQFHRLKSAIIIAIFDYLSSILDKTTSWCANFCQEFFWSFICSCVFDSNTLGFAVDDDVLPEKLTQIFNKFCKRLPQNLLRDLIKYLSNYFEEKYENNTSFNINHVSLNQRNILRGWLLIKNTDLKDKITNDAEYFENSDQLIFQSLVKDGDQKYGIILSNTVWEYANLQLKICLSVAKSTDVLCDCITNSVKIKHPEMYSTVTHGEYYLHTFKEAIMEYIITNHQSFLKTLCCKWTDFSDNSPLNVLISILKYLSNAPELKQKINMADFLENVVYGIYHVYKRGGSLSDRNFQIELLSYVVKVDGKRSLEIGNKYEFLREWFLSQLKYYTSNEIPKIMLQFHTNVLCFLPCFISPLDEQDRQLESALDTFINNTLNTPEAKLDDSDLSVLSKKLLDQLITTKSSIVLKPCMKVSTSLTFDEENINIQKYFDRYLASLSPDQQYKSINKVYDHCYNLNLSEKNKIIKMFLLPMLRSCHYDTFQEFYVQNIKLIIENLKSELSTESSSDDIIKKSASLILIDVLFSRIKVSNFDDKSCPISKALYTNMKKGNELLKETMQSVNQIFKESIKFEDDRKELYRLYHCDALNCLISIVCNSKNPEIDEKWFRALFFMTKENKNIWRNIINTEENIAVPQDFDKLPARKKVFVNVRSKHQQTHETKIHYIESQSLFNSTLSEDICKFDFTNTLVRSPDFREKIYKNEKEDAMLTMSLKSVDYNNHECMPTICALISHIIEEKISDVPSTDFKNAVLPAWMDDIKKLLIDSNVENNIRIFIARVVHNTQNIFKYYGKYFFEAIVKFITDKCTGGNINYFVADLVLMLISWLEYLNLSEIKTPASELINYLMEHSCNDRQDMLKYNLEIIKTSVQIWKSVLTAPHEIIYNKLQNNNFQQKLVGIHLAGILLANDLTPWTLENSNGFINSVTGILNKERLKKITKPCAELIGMMLKYMEDKPEYKNAVVTFNKQLDDIFRSANSDKLFHSLEQIQINYPVIIDKYLRKLTMLIFNESDPALKCISLKNILRRIDINEAKRFTFKDITDLLNVDDNDVRLLTLQIANKMLLDFKKQHQNLIINSVIELKSEQNSTIRYAVYEILMSVYTAYIEEKDSDCIEMIKLCKPILLSALIDTDSEIQARIEEFWYSMYNKLTLTEKYEQFLTGIYSPDVENFYLGCMNYFLLHSCKNSFEYNKLMFGHPLTDCKFDDYQVLYNWRLQNSSIAPLFSTFARDYSAPELVGVRETNSLRIFTPTQSTIDFSSSLQTASSFLFEPVFQAKDTFKNKKVEEDQKSFGKMFLNEQARNLRYAKGATEQNIKIEKARKERAQRKEGNVVMYRQYRKGEFPDIQIPFSALIDPLKFLARRDGILARQLYVMLFSGIVDELEDSSSFIQNINDGILSIFNQSYMYVPNMVGAFLDAAFEINRKKNITKIFIHPDILSNVCKNSGLLPIGCLLMEEYIGMRDDSPRGSKRGCASNDNEVKQWVKLADMYKELNEWDAVVGIFSSSKMNCSSDISSAIQLEANCYWKEALTQYGDLLHTDTDINRKDFYYESFFKCFAQLSDWKNMSDNVCQLSDSNFWDGDWNQEKLLPWYMMAKVNMLLEVNDEDNLMNNLNKWMKEKDKAEYLKDKFCEELAILSLLENDLVSSRHYTKHCFGKFLEDWTHLNPLFIKIRSRKLLNFQKIVDLNKYLTHNNPTDLINYWQNSNLSSYSLPLTEIRSLFRQQFIISLERKFQSTENTEEFSLELRDVKLSCSLNMVDNAIESNNYVVGRKYCKNSKKYISQDNKLGNFKLLLAMSKVGYIMAEKQEGQSKLNVLIDSWDRLDTICRKYSNRYIDLQLESSRQIFKITENIHSSLKKSSDSYPEVQKKISKLIHSQSDILPDLQNYGVNKLRNVISMGENVLKESENVKVLNSLKETYLSLVIFAQSQENEEYHEDIVKCVLRAMKLGSRDARQIFPCLLQFAQLDGKLLEVFKDECEGVPTWMFLLWIPQLLITLDSRTEAVENIVERIALTYPQALIYAYRIAKENYDLNSAASHFKEVIKKLDDTLSNPLIDKFLHEMSFVCIPELYFNYYLEIIMKHHTDCEVIHEKLKLLNDDLKSRIQEQVNFKSIENTLLKLHDEISGVEDYDVMKSILSNIYSMNKTNMILNPNRQLKHFSTWLANFKSSDFNTQLEIPGQYSGESKPLVKYHAKICSFSPKLTCKIKSLRKPFEMVIYGNDSREYSFLVKFGEDLRQDERIQQLFSLTNSILKSDKQCQERNLFLEQYQIIPFSKRFGLIKVVENTKPFSEFIYHHEKDKSTIDQYILVNSDYVKWIRQVARGVQASDADCYAKAALNYDKNEVNMMFNRFVNAIPSDILSKSFWSITMSPSNYTYFRHQFITSYSVMCVAHWLLGIGDRNLGNSLISLRTGRAIGIDFGYAFGAMTQHSIPELIPFRLTPHILALMEPLRETGFVEKTMVHVLKALREKKHLLLSTMDVFIKDPSLDWLEYSKTHQTENQESEMQWHPKFKIDIARRKLDGANPALITVRELRNGAITIPEVNQAYVNIVQGDETNIRSRVGLDGLSEEDQVKCLLDQATDYNILGRQYAGLQLWI